MDLSEKIRQVVIQVGQKLAVFGCLVSLILSWKFVKSLLVTKIVPKMNFGVFWGKLVAENVFQRQSRTKYMRQTLVLM